MAISNSYVKLPEGSLPQGKSIMILTLFRRGGQKPWWTSSAVILAVIFWGTLWERTRVKPQMQGLRMCGSLMFAPKNYP